jgi:hypothetical protein
MVITDMHVSRTLKDGNTVGDLKTCRKHACESIAVKATVSCNTLWRQL